MEDKVTKNIDEIIAGMYCSKNFKCAESGFERLCKAKHIGLERFLECLETDPADCLFMLHVGDHHLCDCPLRVYLAKKFHK
jgi:hypothetical protein